MSSAPTPDEVARDARWLAQALDPASGMVRLVAMNRDSYRLASFLDDRLLQMPVDAQLVPWPELESAFTGDGRTDARWIFHIGHVGSTLVSRLVGDINGVLSVREPRLLRDLAVAPAEIRERYTRRIAELMSRTFAADEVACVKATSFASDIAPELVPIGARALFLYARPRNYIATILAGENSIKELHVLQSFRAQRLARRNIEWKSLGTDADRAAAAWACEMIALEAAADAMKDRHVAFADFDLLLEDLTGGLGTVADALGLAASQEQLRVVANGPVVRRYSKDPKFEYSPALRRQLIDQEVRLQRGEIDRSLAALGAASERSPLLARALRRAEGN